MEPGEITDTRYKAETRLEPHLIARALRVVSKHYMIRFMESVEGKPDYTVMTEAEAIWLREWLDVAADKIDAIANEIEGLKADDKQHSVDPRDY